MKIRLVFRAMVGAAALAVSIGAAVVAGTADELGDAYVHQRMAMIERIKQNAMAARHLTRRPALSGRVLRAMSLVPRHEFVSAKLRRFAYIDMPLPLGHGQSISQPYIVALMTDLAAVRETDIVFETGTGAGYHAAILSRLAKRVVSVEVIAPLALRASATLRRLGYRNVQVITGDGYHGWRKGGPYDVIILKEAVVDIPPPLLAQLKPGGRLVAPIGPRKGPQFLTLIEKGRNGAIKRTPILPVRFTPMQGGERI